MEITIEDVAKQGLEIQGLFCNFSNTKCMVVSKLEKSDVLNACIVIHLHGDNENVSSSSCIAIPDNIRIILIGGKLYYNKGMSNLVPCAEWTLQSNVTRKIFDLVELLPSKKETAKEKVIRLYKEIKTGFSETVSVFPALTQKGKEFDSAISELESELKKE